MSKTHKDLEFAVDDASVTERITVQAESRGRVA